jgi:hypothetical protein
MIHPALLIGAFIAALILIVVLVFSVNMVGYWTRYLRVRIFGGGAIMVKWRSGTDDYFKLGYLGKQTLSVKKRNTKVKTQLTLPNKPPYYRLMGVIHVDLDESTNAFCQVDYTGVAGFDEETYENIVIRALMSPEENYNWKLLLIAGGLTVLGVIILFLMLRHQGSITNLNHEAVLSSIKAYCGVPVV